MSKKIEQIMFQLQKTLDKKQKKHIKKIIKANKYNYKQIDKELQKLYRQYEVEGKLNYSQLVYDGKQVELDYKIALQLVSYYAVVMEDADKVLKEVVSTTVSNIQSIEGIPAIQKTIKADHIINKDMAGLNWLERLGYNRQESINTIQRAIKEGLEQGKLYQDMSKELAKQFSTELYKAERIVRTESHRVLNDTKLQSFQEINKSIPVMKKWISMGDERVREGHSALDGTTIPLTENFVSPLGGEGQAPGLMNNAEDDINCRCIMTMVI